MHIRAHMLFRYASVFVMLFCMCVIAFVLVHMGEEEPRRLGKGSLGIFG